MVSPTIINFAGTPLIAAHHDKGSIENKHENMDRFGNEIQSKSYGPLQTIPSKVLRRENTGHS